MISWTVIVSATRTKHATGKQQGNSSNPSGWEQAYLVYQQQPYYAPRRHWERHRQLIAVTCLTEHA